MLDPVWREKIHREIGKRKHGVGKKTNPDLPDEEVLDVIKGNSDYVMPHIESGTTTTVDGTTVVIVVVFIAAVLLAPEVTLPAVALAAP